MANVLGREGEAGRRWDLVELAPGHPWPAADTSAIGASLTGGAMELYHDGVRLGTLTRHFYETPWASAWLVAKDPTTVARYAAICAFHAWCEQLPGELPDAETEALDAYWGLWTVLMPDGERREIAPPHVDSDGYLTSRW